MKVITIVGGVLMFASGAELIFVILKVSSAVGIIVGLLGFMILAILGILLLQHVYAQIRR